MNVLVDSREPWPHAWQRYLPEGWALERGTLETGDFCLASHPEGAVVERKTPSDMAACVGASRERFERELRRGRYAGRLIVVIEGSLSDVCTAGRELHPNSVVGSIAAWTLRYCPFVFCGSQQVAANFSFRFLAAQLPSGERRRALQARRALPQTPKEGLRAEEEDCAPPF